MNYEANKIHWKVGDIVIHDADAKRENMLMRITELRQDATGGLRYVSSYIDWKYHTSSKRLTSKEFKKWNRWNNPLEVLHDPKRFGIELRGNFTPAGVVELSHNPIPSEHSMASPSSSSGD